MGERWSVDRGDIAVGNFRLTSGSPRELVGWHNADCDAYEATIAALSKTCTELEVDREYNAGLVAERDKRIAELEVAYQRQYNAMDVLVQDLKSKDTELARVKAESLRVVPVNEPIRVGENPIPAITHCLCGCDKFYWIDDNDGLPVEHWAYDLACGGCEFGKIDNDTIVQPVRLKRWEDADVLGE